MEKSNEEINYLRTLFGIDKSENLIVQAPAKRVHGFGILSKTKGELYLFTNNLVFMMEKSKVGQIPQKIPL
jgi:hypothetical protein